MDGWEMTTADPRPEPLRSLVDGWMMDSFVLDFLEGVWAGLVQLGET